MRRAVPLILLSGSASAAALGAPAQAYPYGTTCSAPLRHVWYDFQGSGWDVRPSGGDWGGASYREAAIEGFMLWHGDKNRDGTPTVTVGGYRSGATKVTVQWGGSGGGGSFSCAASTIELETGLKTGTRTSLRAVAAHEMGHALGPDHTGALDDMESYVNGAYENYVSPLMSTCNSFATHQNTVDDAASLVHEHGVGAVPTITANYGFENDLSWFEWRGAAPVLVTGSTSGGAYHARVVPNSSSDNIYQQVNITLGNPDVVRPSMQYTTPGATAGSVRMQLWERTAAYEYDPSAASYCQYPLSADMNVRTSTSAWYLVLDKYLPLSDVWRVGQTDTARLIPDVGRGTVDYEVRVFTSAAITGGYIHTHYDDLRIQEG